MEEKYIQIKGAGRNTNIVTIFKDEGNKITLKTVSHNFEYSISKKDFEKRYKLLSEWEKEKEQKQEQEDIKN